MDVSPDTTVAEFKTMVKEKMPRKLDRIADRYLKVWRCTVPAIDFDDTDEQKLEEQVSKVFSDKKAHQLRGAQKMEATEDLLLVQVPGAFPPSLQRQI